MLGIIQMKKRNFTLVGKTGNNGTLLIANQSEMTEFLKQWPNQNFTIQNNLSQPETSGALVSYYSRSVVPDFQHAFKEEDGERMTLSQVDMKLRKMSSVMHEEIPDEENGGFDLVRLMSISEAGNHRASEYLEDLRLIGATKYGIVVQDPKTL